MLPMRGGVLRRDFRLFLSAGSASPFPQWCRCFSTPAGPHSSPQAADDTSTSESLVLSAHDFAAITPLLLLRQALQQHTELDGIDLGAHLNSRENHIIISWAKFCQFCAAAHVKNPDAALADLQAAGVVVALDGGSVVHLRPVLYLETVDKIRSASTMTCSRGGTSTTHSMRSGSGSNFMLEEAERRVAELTRREKAMRDQLQPAIARAARWRRTVWGGALFYAGAQLAIISRLTYFDLDWDIMEPVTYGITLIDAFLLFLYYLRFNEEYTHDAFDKRYLPRKVRQYAPKDFDWEAYVDVCARLDEERALLDGISNWAASH
ncbi:hypothetical protein JKF63_03240 [Porcisia hertigi]|uniref:Calcium uniporter protein C-terminal domain-containing protein n=1 Tax=Porcisia hertigi TaxID=2761500 RepID=A0A836L957_9TRYP|nr:hypothetical protein JKF63_03240 [Porcisia hertigi]